MTVILAVDPGTFQSGYVLYESGKVHGFGVEANETMLAWIAENALGADVLAVEMIASYGMPVGAEVFDTCVWIGRFQQAWQSAENFRRVLRREVKMHLCGSVKAKDPNVWQALLDKFGPGKVVAVGTKRNPGPLYGITSHARAALAVAVTADELRTA